MNFGNNLNLSTVEVVKLLCQACASSKAFNHQVAQRASWEHVYITKEWRQRCIEESTWHWITLQPVTSDMRYAPTDEPESLGDKCEHMDR